MSYKLLTDHAMDSSSEAKFMKNIKEYLKGKTMILVTHKTSLLALADRIIVMDEGKINLDGKKDFVVNKLAGK